MVRVCGECSSANTHPRRRRRLRSRVCRAHGRRGRSSRGAARLRLDRRSRPLVRRTAADASSPRRAAAPHGRRGRGQVSARARCLFVEVDRLCALALRRREAHRRALPTKVDPSRRFPPNPLRPARQGPRACTSRLGPPLRRCPALECPCRAPTDCLGTPWNQRYRKVGHARMCCAAGSERGECLIDRARWKSTQPSPVPHPQHDQPITPYCIPNPQPTWFKLSLRISQTR
mmetsp:Transcript_55426/g.127389  ORF Transcript_55426/g.127389 Transcript_55426/m.127389 type:complete len:231 (-) Transcript_55426:43-735(-)